MTDLLMYGLAAFGGFLISVLLRPSGTSTFFNDVVMKNVLAGKKVTITIDQEAVMFELVGDKVVIKRGVAELLDESEETT